MLFCCNLLAVLTRYCTAAHTIAAILVQTPIPPRGASGGQHVIYFGFTDPRGCGSAIQPSSMCPRTSNVEDNIHLLRECSVLMTSRTWCTGWGLAVWSDMVFVSAFFRIICTYVRPAFFLLLSVAPVDVLAGATDDCLLHAVCM